MGARAMALSEKAAETLLDLVEIKLSCMEVSDRDDARELAGLEQCRQELLGLVGREDTVAPEIVAFRVRGGRGRMRTRSVA